MYWRVEVKDKEGVFNSASESLKSEIKDFGLREAEDVRIKSVYFLIGSLTEQEADRIASGLLIDAVTQEYRLYGGDESPAIPEGYIALQILYKPGVMDPVEYSTLKGIKDLGIDTVSAVRTARKYLFKGNLSRKDLLFFAEKFLYNKLIELVLPENEHKLYDFSNLPDYKFNLKGVAILDATDKELMRLSSQGQLY
ncbi:MAG TPA: phosphoribosylformylglycinamidine synthase subunit PurS, partial [Candidatus Omnitrophota bacterium]|nr:phosphoribosylformylglycinamidine synthase subunit PurS [Candidatus Omnitrophota bacterium]